MIKAGFIAVLIGVAGIGGAIDQSESLVLPVLVVIAGAALMYMGEKRGGASDKSWTNSHSSNLHNYPAGLEGTRRRRA